MGQAFAGPNANAVLSLDLIVDGGAGNQRDDGVTAGTVTGRGTTIAIEVFATNVATSLVGLNVAFDFDETLLRLVKAENPAFGLAIPQGTGVNIASTTPVALNASGFLVRAEFVTIADVTGQAGFSIGIETVVLAESLSSLDEIATTREISFTPATHCPGDFDDSGDVDFVDFLALAAGFGKGSGDANGRVTTLDLGGNNGLRGEITAELGSLSNLQRLSLDDNEFTGALPSTFTGLRRLEFLSLNGTQLCAPVDAAFQAWLRWIGNKRGVVNCEETTTGASKIYWSNRTDKVSRANPDGSNVEDLVIGMGYLDGLALDVSGGKMYWTDSAASKVSRANLDGSNVEDLVRASRPRGIDLDASAGKMYWTDSSWEKIFRANLDGSNIEDVVTGLGVWVRGFALDVSRGRMYWTDRTRDSTIKYPLTSTSERKCLSKTKTQSTLNSPKIGLDSGVHFTGASRARG